MAYLRLYQRHPNVESILLHGLPQVLDELITEQTDGADWSEKNRKAELELPEIRWEETRPAQMLGLNRDELVTARKRGWGVLFWRLFTRAKAAGERLTDADITHAFYLGDEDILELVGRGPVGKSLRYLLRQIEQVGVEPEDEDPQPEGVIDVSILLDYWRMAELTGRDLADPDVRWPEDLLEAHDRMSDAVTQFEARELASKFRIRRKQLARYAFQWRGLLIRPAASQKELVEEGDALHHCVGTYANDHANGKTAIFFVRRVKEPGNSYFTLELDEGKLTVRQNRGRRNCARTKEVEAFEAIWLAWLRTGAPRDASVAGGIKVQSGDCGMKKTSLKELRSFSKAELIRYVQYVEGEPLRAHHTAARTYIYELRLERVNKRYDAAIKELNALTQGPKTLQEFGEWIKVHETVSRCIAELERLEKLLYG